jgi:hypothetical protein
LAAPAVVTPLQSSTEIIRVSFMELIRILSRMVAYVKRSQFRQIKNRIAKAVKRVAAS